LISLAGFGGGIFFGALAFNRQPRLVRSFGEVEKTVAVRTQQLQEVNAQLLHNQKMTALGTLAAGIAHDFNNILSIIKGSAQIIEANPEDPEKIRTRVDRIKTVVDQGAGIVKAMLGFGRPSENQLAPCNFNHVIQETIQLLGDRFLRETEVKFEPEKDLPGVPAAKDFLQQMLLNFIFNAADATAGPGQIILQTGVLDKLPEHVVLPPTPAPRHVFISVKDFGSGISPEVLPRIFEPFFTTKAFSSRRGTGLGLSMVYQMAKEMGYGLTVESKVGKGSTFTLIVPLK
jgi:two-component system cell cycle sensor histidine kinase/response regulator CckA